LLTSFFSFFFFSYFIPHLYLLSFPTRRSSDLIFHFLKQIQIFLNASVPVRTFLSWLCEGTSVFPDFLRAEITDKSFAFFYQIYSSLIHLVKIIRSKIKPVFPVSSQPFQIGRASCRERV